MNENLNPQPSITIKIEVISEGGRTVLEFVGNESVKELKQELFFRALLLLHKNQIK